MDYLEYNREAWNRQVEDKNIWTLPVSPEEIAAARKGEWALVLTPIKKVPRSWYGDTVVGKDVLCLASGGGQQGPILAAAGAKVTVFDNSPRQLAQDRQVAERDGLTIQTVQGDMADLSALPDASFDLIFHPVSNCFVPDVLPVWREAFRVLRPGGILLAGFSNPVTYLFDPYKMKEGILQVRYSLPYADVTDIPEEERLALYGPSPLEWSHTLSEQIGGQLAAGFHLVDFYEDTDNDESNLITRFMQPFIATRAIKPL